MSKPTNVKPVETTESDEETPKPTSLRERFKRQTESSDTETTKPNKLKYLGVAALGLAAGAALVVVGRKVSSDNPESDDSTFEADVNFTSES